MDRQGNRRPINRRALLHRLSAQFDGTRFSLVSPQGRPDVFGPFIRVTNSYNALRALVFDIGFFRKVCTNGLILRDAIIQLPRGLGLKLARATRGTEKEPMMSLDVFMNDTCPKCRKLIKLTAVEPHPTNC